MNNLANDSAASIEDNTLAYEDGWPRFREHSLVEAAVTEAARELQVSREMAMMCAFGAMATACQGHVDVQMPTGHLVPTSLMLLTIADSGERKTTTLNYFSEAISTVNNAAHQANEAALVEYKVKHQLWSMTKRHLERMYSKCASQEDEAVTHAALKAITAHVRTEPQTARSGKFLYEDTTPQALVQMLNENTPSGCLLTSEANSIFSGKALGELDKLNTLWDGGNVIVDRVSRDGFILKDARLTLSLMTQPSVIAKFMGKRGEEARGTGFLARFFVVKPRLMAGQRSQRQLSALPRKRDFNARILERLDFAASPVRQVLRFSEPAANRWYKYSQYLEQQMQENGLYYYLKDHASKLLENTSRLAAVLHTFERASNDDIEIDLLTLEFSWEFARICSGHFTKHLANEPQLVTDANHLAHYLLQTAYKNTNSTNNAAGNSRKNEPDVYSRHTPRPENLRPGAKTTFTLTQIKQYGPGSLRGRVNSERLDAAIELLTKLGHISKEGGRYKFKETIQLKFGDPILRNGEIITIKELPLFNEQVYWKPDRLGGLVNTSGYFMKV